MSCSKLKHKSFKSMTLTLRSLARVWGIAKLNLGPISIDTTATIIWSGKYAQLKTSRQIFDIKVLSLRLDLKSKGVGEAIAEENQTDIYHHKNYKLHCKSIK